MRARTEATTHEWSPLANRMDWSDDVARTDPPPFPFTTTRSHGRTSPSPPQVVGGKDGGGAGDGSRGGDGAGARGSRDSGSGEDGDAIGAGCDSDRRKKRSTLMGGGTNTRCNDSV